MRSFKLYNRIGESYDLNDLQFFLYNPSGLGMQRDTKFERIGNNYVPYSDGFKQSEPSGTIRFKNPNAYDKYYDFARFISKTPLRLEYTPNENTYHLDCIMTVLNKTEIGAGGLHCDVKLKALGFYYNRYSLSSNSDEDEGKVYSYTYPYKYSSAMPGTVYTDIDSNMDSPTIITIYGPCENPTWKHYLNNALYATGYCGITLLTGHRLVIDSASAPFSITERDEYDNVLFDRYEDSDFSTERFIFLKAGHNRITVSHDGVKPPDIKVEARVLYETV